MLWRQLCRCAYELLRNAVKEDAHPNGDRLRAEAAILG
jgi:hypothetical protein